MVGRTDHWMLPLPRPVAQPAGMAWLLLLLLAAEPCEQRQTTYAYIRTYALGRFLGVGTRNKHVLLASSVSQSFQKNLLFFFIFIFWQY